MPDKKELDEMRLKWMRPQLVDLSTPTEARGACTLGTGNPTFCTQGASAGNFCAVGTAESPHCKVGTDGPP